LLAFIRSQPWRYWKGERRRHRRVR
jgi:hypothetical protein